MNVRWAEIICSNICHKTPCQWCGWRDMPCRNAQQFRRILERIKIV